MSLQRAKTKKPKPVLVKWLDAHDENDTWIEADEIERQPCVITTLGFILANGKPKHITIAQSYSDELLYNNIIYIPEGMVVELTYID